MRGQPGCAWRSMFLCKLQTFQPSLGDSRGHAGSLQSTEGACRAHICCSVAEGHQEVTILLVRMLGTAHSGSGLRSPRPLQCICPYTGAKRTPWVSASSSHLCHLVFLSKPGLRTENHNPATGPGCCKVLRAHILLQSCWVGFNSFQSAAHAWCWSEPVSKPAHLL